MLAHQPSATDLLFITLRKSEALFSPSTRYRDLALGPSLFHWESQSTTTAAASATGQRYIHLLARGSRVLLYRCVEAFGYVREQRRQGTVTEPFCLPGVCAVQEPRGGAADGGSLAAGAGDAGDGVGGLRPARLESTPPRRP